MLGPEIALEPSIFDRFIVSGTCHVLWIISQTCSETGWLPENGNATFIPQVYLDILVLIPALRAHDKTLDDGPSISS